MNTETCSTLSYKGTVNYNYNEMALIKKNNNKESNEGILGMGLWEVWAPAGST